MMTAARSSNRPYRGLIVRRAGPPVALTAALLTGCGQSIDPGAAVSTTIAAPTTTVPVGTTTTIDFDRPVVEGTEPLAVDAGPDAVAALVADLRGQTASVAGQMIRLAPFPKLFSPPKAQIIDLRVTLEPPDELGRHPSTAMVRSRVPDRGPVAIAFIDDSMKALSWNQVDETVRSVQEATITELEFRLPGRNEEEELVALVEERPGVTVIEFAHRILANDGEVAVDGLGTYFDRLSAWQAALPIPPAATLVEAEVATADDEGRLGARYRLAAADEAEAVAAVLARIGPVGYQLTGVADGERPTAGPLALVDENGTEVTIDVSAALEPQLYELEASFTFELEPLE